MSKNSGFNDFSYSVTNFLGKYLPNEGGVSINTIYSYRDTFKLWIEFLHNSGVKLNKITYENVTRENIIDFLDWLETEKHNSVSTRNVRLAALHSFAKYLLIENPEFMTYAQIILSVKKKKCQKSSAGYLSVQEIKYILEKAKLESTRHYTLLLVLYETGCRVQELCDLKWEYLRLDNPSTISVCGKGNKVRVIPISSDVAQVLKDYKTNYCEKFDVYVFQNHSHTKLTREGVTHILKKYVKMAKNEHDDLFKINVTPHIVRHSRAMALITSGVDLIYIRDILGHVDLKTTEIYARIDSEMRRNALLKVNAITDDTDETNIWNKDKTLLDWLNSLKK